MRGLRLTALKASFARGVHHCMAVRAGPVSRPAAFVCRCDGATPAGAASPAKNPRVLVMSVAVTVATGTRTGAATGAAGAAATPATVQSLHSIQALHGDWSYGGGGGGAAATPATVQSLHSPVAAAGARAKATATLRTAFKTTAATAAVRTSSTVATAVATKVTAVPLHGGSHACPVPSKATHTAATATAASATPGTTTASPKAAAPRFVRRGMAGRNGHGIAAAALRLPAGCIPAQPDSTPIVRQYVQPDTALADPRGPL